MRRLLILASSLVLFDVAFFSAIAPLLPDYVADLGLSKAEAGVLTAAYAAGTLIASLPAGLLATRVGPRPTVIAGLGLLGVSSLVFGFGRQIGLLDAARFTQGVAGALVWSGALAWLISASPPERRGGVIGTVLGTAVAGALVGPALGALAAAVGTEAVFGAVLGIAAVFVVVVLRMPAPPSPVDDSVAAVLAAALRRPVLISTAFVTVPSLMFGAVDVLVPLRVAEFGGGHALIAAGFIGAAACEGLLAPAAGRYSDRAGRRRPFVAGLLVAALAMAGIAAAQGNVGLLAGLLASAVGAGVCFTPAVTMLSEAAEAGGLHQGLAAGLSNMAWASGNVVGSVAGGALAGAAGHSAPCLALAAALGVTAAYALRRGLPLPRPRAVGAG